MVRGRELLKSRGWGCGGRTHDGCVLYVYFVIRAKIRSSVCFIKHTNALFVLVMMFSRK